MPVLPDHSWVRPLERQAEVASVAPELRLTAGSPLGPLRTFLFAPRRDAEQPTVPRRGWRAAARANPIHQGGNEL